MKAFIAIFVSILAISVTTRAEVTQLFAKEFRIPETAVQKCLEENNLKDLDMAQLESVLQEKGLSSEDVDEFLVNFGCIITCMLEKAGIIQDNEILVDELIKLAIYNNYPMNDDIKEKLSKCIDTAKEEGDKCKMGLALTSCFAQIIEYGSEVN